MKYLESAVFSVLLLSLFTICASAQKMQPEEIINKHLDSIGTAEKRNSLKSIIVVGEASIKFITQKNLISQGRIVLASAGEKMFFGMNLNAVDYPSEKFTFNGRKAKVDYVINNNRSPLGNFLQSNDLIIEESLLSGTLLTSWALSNLANKKAKLSFEGTKKIDGKEAYVIGYTRKSGSDIDISLYFDKETFRHVRTEYKRIASAAPGRTIDESARQSETRLKIVESFSDFKSTDGITLPQKYTLFYSVNGQNGTNEIEWSFNLTQFSFNQNITDSTFDINAKEQIQ